MPKYTAPQREQIRKIVQKAYLVGFRPDAILRLLTERDGQKYPMTKRMLESYLAEVKEEAKKSSKFDRDEELGRAKEKLEALYRKCETSKDRRGALAVQKEINQLLGLIVQQHEHKGKMQFENWVRGASERAADKRREKEEKDALAAEKKAAGEKKDGTDLKTEPAETPEDGKEPEPPPGEAAEPESEQEDPADGSEAGPEDRGSDGG